MNLVAIIDLQEKLVPAIEGCDSVLEAASKLVFGARLLEIPLAVTEQNPAKLGSTVTSLDLSDVSAISKLQFDSSDLLLESVGFKPKAIYLAGCEAHICIRQTVRGLRDKGYRVIVAADAIGSRKSTDYQLSLRAIQAMGAELATVEAVLFDWLGTAGHEKFRQISKLIK